MWRRVLALIDTKGEVDVTLVGSGANPTHFTEVATVPPKHWGTTHGPYAMITLRGKERR